MKAYPVFLIVVLTLGILAVMPREHHKRPSATAAIRALPSVSPQYPKNAWCSPLTSLYGSWTDLDGSRRKMAHTGVDGGRLGEWITAPANGRVKAVWRANWGVGREGALLIVHTREDLNLTGGAPYYYSEFDHLNYEEIKAFKVGQKIKRGQRLARVWRPGGKSRYLPEVHWEVWEVWRDRLVWKKNRYKAPVWQNKRARLVDPVSMLHLNVRTDTNSTAGITPPYQCGNRRACRGFSYILPCKPK